MPHAQSFLGTPSTKIVAGTAGSVVMRSEPWRTKDPWTWATCPARTSIVVGGGGVTP
ncbi:MAG: hypothetical protein ACT4OI_04355 [Methanobacteriota archaeon]